MCMYLGLPMSYRNVKTTLQNSAYIGLYYENKDLWNRMSPSGSAASTPLTTDRATPKPDH